MIATPVYTIEGIPEIIRKLNARMRRLQNMSGAFALIAADYYRLQKGWMDSEGRGEWVDLAENYARWKRNKVGNKRKLQFTGEMYQDMTSPNTGGLSISRGKMTIRAPLTGRRWVYHQRGLSTGNKSGNARPRRRVLSPALQIRQARWNRMIRDWIAGQNVK